MTTIISLLFYKISAKRFVAVMLEIFENLSHTYCTLKASFNIESQRFTWILHRYLYLKRDITTNLIFGRQIKISGIFVRFFMWKCTFPNNKV